MILKWVLETFISCELSCTGPSWLHCLAYIVALTASLCCILRGPGGGRIVDVVPGGTELELQVKRGDLGRPHTLALIPTSSILEFIVHEL
jgi:hypothetical protein